LGLAIPATPDPGIRAAVNGLSADQPYLTHAESVLTDQCMRKQGFSYPIQPAKQSIPRDATYGLSVADAQTSGYTSESQELKVPSFTSDNSGPSNAGDQARYSAALFGPPGSPSVTAQAAFMGASMGTSSVGCLADAQRELFGSMEAAVQQTTYESNFSGAGLRESATDPALHTLNQQWSSCMSAAGHPGLADPDHAKSQGQQLAGRQITGLSTGPAKELAVADATCEQQLNYAAQRQNTEDRYLTALVHRIEGEFTAAQESTKTAMANAAKVLTGS
jgi:hypothetical protein